MTTALCFFPVLFGLQLAISVTFRLLALATVRLSSSDMANNVKA